MSEKKKESNFLMQGTILGMAAIITKLIGLAYRIPLTNIMGAEGNGYYGVVYQVYNLALMLTSYSLPMAVSKLVAARVAKGQYKNAYRVYKGALTFGLISGGSVAALVFLGAGFISRNILKMDLSVYALRVLAPCILIVAILGVLRGYFQGHGTMVPTAISQILEQIVHALVSLIAAYMLLKFGQSLTTASNSDSYGAAYAAAGATLGTVIGALAAMIFLLFVFGIFKKRNKRAVKKDETVQLESQKYIFKILILTIVPVILSATIYNISNLLDQAIFSNVMAAQGYTEKEYTSLLGMFNGQYDTITNIPLSLASALAASFMPSLVATIQTGTKKQIYNKLNMVSRFNMIIAIPCAAGLIALARPVLDLLFYTQDNEIPAMLLRIGAISVVFFCLSTVTNAALQGMDKMSKPVKNAAISLVIHIVALLVMLIVFKWNIYSIVLSKIIFAAAICILNAHDLREACGYVQERKQTFIIPSIASILMAVAAIVVQMVFGYLIGDKIGTVIAICVAVAVYAVAMVVMGGITEAELLTFPKGGLLVKIFKKVHLLKSE